MINAATDTTEPELRLSREEYRRWAENQLEGRFERIEGVVVAMAPERLIHADRKALVWLVLRQAVAAAGLPCHVYPDGMTVEVDDTTSNPTSPCIAVRGCRETRSPYPIRWCWWRFCPPAPAAAT